MFARLDDLGLDVVGQRLEPDRAVLACRVGEPGGWCRPYGCEGTPTCGARTPGAGASAIFTGFKTATAEELPEAGAVMDPLHVARLAGQALDQCRCFQQDTHGHRGRKDDPRYQARRTLHTGADLITDEQRQQLHALVADDTHVQVEATWGIDQRMIAAYREPDHAKGHKQMGTLMAAVSTGVPGALREIITLGRTADEARRRRPGAYFDRPGTSNGPTEAINGASNTYAAPPSASATSPTTWPDAYSRSAASDPNDISIMKSLQIAGL